MTHTSLCAQCREPTDAVARFCGGCGLALASGPVHGSPGESVPAPNPSPASVPFSRSDQQRRVADTRMAASNSRARCRQPPVARHRPFRQDAADRFSSVRQHRDLRMRRQRGAPRAQPLQTRSEDYDERRSEPTPYLGSMAAASLRNRSSVPAGRSIGLVGRLGGIRCTDIRQPAPSGYSRSVLRPRAGTSSAASAAPLSRRDLRDLQPSGTPRSPRLYRSASSGADPNQLRRSAGPGFPAVGSGAQHLRVKGTTIGSAAETGRAIPIARPVPPLPVGQDRVALTADLQHTPRTLQFALRNVRYSPSQGCSKLCVRQGGNGRVR